MRSRGRWSIATRLWLVAMTLICLSGGAATASWIVSLGPAPDGTDLQFSPRVTDRSGRLLRAYTTSDGRWRLPARIADVDPRFFEMLFAYEDRRFREHPGVDALALVRAAVQLVDSGRIRSGGSTLTMQVARLLEPRNGRTLAAKLHQIVRAVEIERILTKGSDRFALSRTRALWRQYRGDPCRFACLFRQRAAAADARRSGAAGGAAAIAGGAKA
jgi:penicillin-binding protein 1C